MSLQYAQVQPESLKSSYKQNETVDFVLTFEGKKLLLNNLRLVGNIRVNSTGTTRLTDEDDIFIDNLVGIHSVINRVNTEFQTKKNVENFKHYNRYYSMLMKTTNTQDDMFNGSQLCELKSADETFTRNMLIESNNGENVDFSIKPYFILNNAIAEDGARASISYTETGAVKISFDLARNTDVLYGSDCVADTSYELSNLKLHYIVVPDDGKKQKLTMLTKASLKPELASTNAVLSSKIPVICNSCSISFQKRSNENTTLHNNLAMERLPNLRRVEFLFNDNQMNYITYILEDYNEIIQRYLESFGSKDNSLTLSRINGNKAFGVGTAFNGLGYINLSNQKFNVKLESDVKSSDPYNAYLFFHGILEL